MKFMKYVLFLLVILLVSPAYASIWKWCGNAHGSGSAEAGYSGRVSTLCTDFISGDIQSAMLNVEKCDNIDFIYESDMSGAGVAISIQVMVCVSPTIDANSCKPLADESLAGTDSDFTIGGGYGSYMYIQGTGTIGAETPRTLAKCNRNP